MRCAALAMILAAALSEASGGDAANFEPSEGLDRVVQEISLDEAAPARPEMPAEELPATPEDASESAEALLPALPAPPPAAEAASLSITLERAAELSFHAPIDLPGQALEITGTTEAPASAAPLLEQLARAGETDQRLRAVEGFAQLPDAGAMDWLIHLACDREEAVRTAAARGLLERDPEHVSRRLMQMLMQPTPAFLAAAPSVLPILEAHLGPLCLRHLQGRDTPASERAICAWALGEMRHEPAAASLAQLSGTAEPGLARAAASALYRLNSAQSYRDWLKLMEHRDPEIVTVALHALSRSGNFEGQQMVAATAAGMTRPEEALQLHALEAIRGWPDHQSVPVMIDIMVRNPRLGPVLNKILKEKTGQDFGSNPVIWRDWWLRHGAGR